MSLAVHFETLVGSVFGAVLSKHSVAWLAALHLLPLRDPCAAESNRRYDVAERIASRVERHSRTSKIDYENSAIQAKVVRTRLQLEDKIEVKSR